MSFEVKTGSFKIETAGFGDILDITKQVQIKLSESSLLRGNVTVFVSGSTAGITTIEYEPGAVDDLKKAIERQVPENLHYAHDARWGDGNGFSHVRAALMGASLTIPFLTGKLKLGTWQQIILCDFDNRARTRDILIQIIGAS